MAAPNPDDFRRNEKANEYEVRFAVRGEITETLTAASPEEAREKARQREREILDETFGRVLDAFQDVRVAGVYKSRPMFLVLRDGQPMQTTHLHPGDLPREPDERGF